MLTRVCVAVVGPAIICGVVGSTSASAQAGTLTAAVSGIVAVPVGPLVADRTVSGGGAFGLRYAPTAVPGIAMRVEFAGLWPASRNATPPDESPVISNGSSTLSLLAGPEFDVPAFNGHFYATAAAGAAHIWATSTASSAPTPAFGPFNLATSRQATNLAWSGGGGFMTARSGTGIAGIFGVQYYDLGRATYVTTYPAGSLAGNGSGFQTRAPTVAHHRVTFLAPSVGLSWRP